MILYDQYKYESITIKLKMVELRKQKAIKTEFSEIHLFSEGVRFRMVFFANEPQEDEALAWKQDVYNHYDGFFPKDKIAGIEKGFNDEDEIWQVIIFIEGVSNYLKCYFETEGEADGVFEPLVKWLYGWR